MTSKFDHCTISIPTKQTYMDEIKDIFPNNIGNNPIFKSMRFSNGLGLLKLKPTFKLNMKSFNEDLNDTMFFSGIPPENKPKSKSLYEKVDNRISKFNNNVKINNPLRGNHSSNSIILRVNNEYLDKYNSSFKQSYNHIIDKIQKNQEKNSILQISPLNKSSILINKKKNIIVRNNKALQIISDN